MKKKLISAVLAVLAISLTLTGCGNDTSKKSVEQAKMSIESKEYDKAIDSLEVALDEDKENKEAEQLYNMVNDYQEAKKFLEENDIEGAKKSMNKIDKGYTNYSIKDDIDNLKATIDEKEKKSAAIAEEIARLDSLIGEKKYDEVINSLNELNTEGLSSEQKKKIDELKDRVDKLKSKVNEVKAKAEELKSQVSGLKDRLDSEIGEIKAEEQN